MLEKVQNEIDMVKRNPEEYRSAFYIMQKKMNADGSRGKRQGLCVSFHVLTESNVFAVP
ncbi:MAG: hypothetical protein ACXW1F_06140 [Halobacteriota archaeon]